ncbi:MAG: STAS domain-containing protein [Planctomycetes bacterium]|nr:STAS domain-containing protein [Planctomycetota bacterium]
MRRLELDTCVIDKSVSVTLLGDVDAHNAGELKSRLAQAVAGGTPVLFLDLAGVRRMDSAGVAVLVELRRSLGEQGRTLALLRIPPSVRRILELLGTVDVIFDVYTDLDEGLRRTQQLRGVLPRLHDPTQKLKPGP